MSSDNKPKKTLSEAQIEQRRAAGKKKKTLSDAALEQRRTASKLGAANATGPKTAEGKLAARYNACKHKTCSPDSVRRNEYVRAINKKSREALSDGYVTALLKNSGVDTDRARQIGAVGPLIKAKRAALKLKRLLKENRCG